MHIYDVTVYYLPVIQICNFTTLNTISNNIFFSTKYWMDACRDYNYHYSVKSLKFIFFKKIENQNGSIATGPKPTSIIQKKKKKENFEGIHKKREVEWKNNSTWGISPRLLSLSVTDPYLQFLPTSLGNRRVLLRRLLRERKGKRTALSFRFEQTTDSCCRISPLISFPKVWNLRIRRRKNEIQGLPGYWKKNVGVGQYDSIFQLWFSFS